MQRLIFIGLVALLLGLVVAACQREPRAVDDTNIEGTNVMRTLKSGTQSGAQWEGLVVCRDANAWQALWKNHSRLQLPMPPMPPVDFDSECVVAVFLGPRPTSGYGVSVLGFEEIDGGWTLRVHESTPEPGMAQMQVMTMPFAMLAVPHFEGAAGLQYVP